MVASCSLSQSAQFTNSLMDETVAKFPKIFKPLDDPYRYKMIWGGRGKGASWTVGRKLLIRGAEKRLRILCTRELQKSIKQSVHKLLSDQIYNLGLQNFYDIQQQGIQPQLAKLFQGKLTN